MSLPRRLKSQATSSSRDTTKPAQCFLSSSLRSSESFVLVSFPANLTGNSVTGSHGRGGRSPPQTLSTRFSDTATRSDPPLFLIFSASFLAMELESKVGSTPPTFPPADSSAASYSDEWLSSDGTTKRRDPAANLAQTSAASDCRVLSYYTYRSCALS